MTSAKILIVSDSHRLKDELEYIKQKHIDEVDLWIHCGDSELSSEQAAMSGFLAVRGNCDFTENYPEELVVEVADRKIFVAHGHLFSVKTTLMRLFYRAKEQDANIVCFGHSHMLGVELVDDVLFINPGSIKLPRGRKEKTYCILELGGESAYVRVYDIATGEIDSLSQSFTLPINS